MALLLSPWFWLALAVAAAGAATKGWIDEKAAFDSFKGATEALGEQARERTATRIKTDKLAKEKADAQNKVDRDNFRATVIRLRNERTSSSFVPAAPAGAASPDRAAFGRADLERAIRELDQGVQGLVDQGSAAIIDLDTAKRWAQDTK